MKSIIAYISVLLIILFSTYAVAVIIETPGTGNTAKFLAPFRMLDSLGNTVVANDAYDSVKVLVWGMGGYCYYAKMLMSDARIYDTLIDGQDFFCFMDDLQDIDSTGSAGTYGYDIRVWDSTYEWWSPAQIGIFIASPTSWEEQIDSLAKMIDSLESYDDWVAKQADLQKAIDSLAKIIDSLESYDGWVSHQSTVDSLVDSLNVLLVQQGKVIDSLYAVLDSIQAGFASRLPIGDTSQGVDEVFAEVQNIDGWNPATGSTLVDMSSFNAALDNDTSLVNFLRAAIGGIWTTAQRDSLLDALKDASMGDKIWVDAAARTLTAFGFTLDSLDFDATFKHMIAIYSDSGGTTSGVWSQAQRDSVLSALADQVLALKVWNIAFNYGFAAGSIADSLTNASYVQGSAAGVDSNLLEDMFGRYADSTQRQVEFGDTTFTWMLNADTFLTINNPSGIDGGDSSWCSHPSIVEDASGHGADGTIDSISASTPTWRYAVAFTPLMGGSDESPCIGVSNDGETFINPYYVDSAGDTVFASMPLVSNTYINCTELSDAEIFQYDDTTYIYFRAVWDSPIDSTHIYAIWSVNEVNWSDTVLIRRDATTGVHLVTPAVCSVGVDSVGMWYVDDHDGVSTTPYKVYRIWATHPIEDFDTATAQVCTWNASSTDWEVWHIEVDKYNGKYYVLAVEMPVGGTSYQSVFALSDNGLTFYTKADPILGVGDPDRWDDRIHYQMAGLIRDYRPNPYYQIWYSAQTTNGWRFGRSNLYFTKRAEVDLVAVSNDEPAARSLEGILDRERRRVLNADLLGFASPLESDNLVYNGSFENDSVTGTTVPDGWTQQQGAPQYSMSGSIRDSTAVGKWKYQYVSQSGTPHILSQYLGYLPVGKYRLSAKFNPVTMIKVSFTLNMGDTVFWSGWTDSLSADTDVFINHSKIVEIDSATDYSFGIVLQAGVMKMCELDNIIFRYIEPLASSGSNLITYYAVDTTGTDSVLPNIEILVEYPGGQQKVIATTGSSGCATFHANDYDTLLITATGFPDHIFLGDNASGYDTLYVADSNMTDTAEAYDWEIGTPAGAHTCLVYFFITDLSANLLTKGPRLIIELKTDRAVRDTCNNVYLADYMVKSVKPDSNGKVEIELIWNSCLDDPSLQYHAKLRYRGGEKDLGDFTVPDETSYRLICED